MYRYKIANSLALCVLFICIVFVVNRHGENNRQFASGEKVLSINAPEKAYYIWKENNVKGRTLILFDSYPHNMGLISYAGIPQLSNTNFVEFSIFKNIIRRIYFIVPETDWNDFRSQKYIRPIREASELVKGLYLYNQSGIPIIAVTPSSLPSITEQALVYINSSRFKSEEALNLLSQNKISSDIIITYENESR
jgi:hypothetical protein